MIEEFNAFTKNMNRISPMKISLRESTQDGESNTVEKTEKCLA